MCNHSPLLCQVEIKKQTYAGGGLIDAGGTIGSGGEARARGITTPNRLPDVPAKNCLALVWIWALAPSISSLAAGGCWLPALAGGLEQARGRRNPWREKEL